MRARRLTALLALACLATEAGAATGTGPGGYIWRDCEEVDGPACDYVMVADTDDTTGLCSDEVYRPPGGFGFAFPFYGTSYTNFRVSANGTVYLASGPGSDPVNAALTGNEGRPFVAPLWDDWAMDNDDELALLCPDPGCSNTGPLTAVESYQVGGGVDAAGAQFFDVEWFDTAKHRPTCSEPETATFGVRFYADGRILFNYFDVEVAQPAETDRGISSTVGISRGTAGEFTQVSFDTASIPYVPYAILFVPPCSALRCNSITAPSDACEGEPIDLRANVAGGVAPLTFSWDFDGDTVVDATGNPVTRALPAGLVTVSVTVTDECADPGPQSCTTSKVVNVHATPVPVVSPQSSTSFCGADGEDVTLLADVGYASYQWSRDGLDIPAATTRTLVANTSGSYVVRVVDAFGCEGVSLPVAVDAEDCTAGCTPLLCERVLVSPDPACEGRQVSLTAIFSGGEGAVTASWDVDGDTVPDVNGNPLRRVFPPGNHPVTAFVTDTCATPAPQQCSMPGLVNVKFTPFPSITPSGSVRFCAAAGESVTLDAGIGWASHQWYRDGVLLPGETAQTMIATVTGTYTVRVSDGSGCEGESLPLDVDADACTTACVPVTCGNVTVTPPVACEGETQELLLDVSGGEPPVGVAWDLDGDGAPDASGNPVVVTLPVGVNAVRGVAADGCTNPGPQSCDGFGNATVLPGAAGIGEVSGPGDPPLLVLTKAARLEVEDVGAATAYHAYVDAIGSWWAPSDPTGRACALTAAGPGARPGTVVVDVTLPVNAWIVVVGANPCGEGVPGTSSRGVDRSTGAGWTACGAAP